MEGISDNNPHLEEMKERGWCWVQRSLITGAYGAPHTDDVYSANGDHREHQETLIVFWE